MHDYESRPSSFFSFMFQKPCTNQPNIYSELIQTFLTIISLRNVTLLTKAKDFLKQLTFMKLGMTFKLNI